MTQDRQYMDLDYHLPEISHKYGEHFHLLKDPYLMTLLEKISSPSIHQPLLTHFVKAAYRGLFHHLISHSLYRVKVNSPTRMINFHPEGIYKGEVIDGKLKVVCVDLARAGMIPSQMIYEELNYILHFENVRQDHFYAARKVNDKNEVIGVDISGSKIGGDIDQAFVILPDPMGATGGTICEAIRHYKNHVKGNAIKFMTAHLIITPEYIHNLKKNHPDVEVYAIRMDRGLSSSEVLSTIPGTYPEKEKGLNEHQYIVPGAGGVGELLNNSFV